MSNGPTPCVVDTNVILVANKQSKDASEECVRTCARRLNEIRRTGHVVVDHQRRMFKEYPNKTLKQKGQRQAGDEFVLWMITHQHNPKFCTRIILTPKTDEQDFVEFPDHPELTKFDRSDRVFVAVANAHPAKPPILAGCDTDHWKCRDAFKACGIPVEFLCEADVRKLAARKGHGKIP